jgi:crotonobetainyl-CoA:carnitine CoA-transferase CaiB-like acyl-CoA transferase
VSVSEPAPALPLAGIRVLELGHIVAGPSAGLILAELGADVCKVEDPRTGDTARNQANAGTTFFAFNRNKRSIALDLRSGPGREIFGRLVRQSDVVLDNYSDGALDRLGVGYARGSRLNPRIIYCSIKGCPSSSDRLRLTCVGRRRRSASTPIQSFRSSAICPQRSSSSTRVG